MPRVVHHGVMDDMTAEDYESVALVGQLLHEQGWRKAFTVNEMMATWQWLVAKVEVGYDENVYEYANDLACRDWLALAWPHLTERVREACHGTLTSLDARFLAATTEDADRRLSREQDEWWRRRLPVRRLGEFADDLTD